MTPVEWTIADRPVDYPTAVAAMEQRVAAIHASTAAEQVWLVEHPPLYTKGTSARPDEIAGAPRFPVFETGRGGRYTYHGPGQRVAYLMLDLRRRGRDVRAFVCAIENWLIDSLAELGVRAERRSGRVGVWVRREDGSEAKIAAVGLRLRRWISFHGASINVEPDLGHYDDIVPCGVREHGVTSLVDLGLPVTMSDVDVVLRRQFEQAFGETTAAREPVPA